MLHNRACEGWVVHARHTPTPHRLRYRVWMAWLDIDALERLDGLGPFWSRKRLRLIAPNAADYQRGSGNLRADIEHLLAADGLAAPRGPIFLLTQPKSWGMAFNPVSFYFCFAEDGQTPETIVAEITNTPWRERFSYVLDARDRDPAELKFAFRKAFHVSPFLSMDIDYEWRFRLDADRIDIGMRLARGGIPQFYAGLDLACRPLDRREAMRAALRFPLQNLNTLRRIYWHAFLLWRKRTPFFAHPVQGSIDDNAEHPTRQRKPA